LFSEKQTIIREVVKYMIKMTGPKIIPHLWFDKDAKKAAEFYVSVFPNSEITNVTLLNNVPTPTGDSDIVSFQLNGQPFMAISAGPAFKFNEAISFVIPCKTQEEIDYYWEKLSADPTAEQCGWCKDKFGLFWQVWPEVMGELMKNGTREQIGRITQAFLPMKKFNIEKLKKAYEGK
jgi:predicted 3-demethylubiquinone-9 3-methyltransferase (glyoxalase superfamily)